MEDYFNILQKMLQTMGLDIFSKEQRNCQLIIRLIYIVTLLFLILALFYSSFDSRNDFVDKLLKYVYNLGNIVVLIQVVLLLKNKSKILDLSIWLKESYMERNLMIVRCYSKEHLMKRYKTTSVNLLKMTLSSGCISAIMNCAIPFIVDDGYIYPLELTFTNLKRINSFLNYVLQAYMWLLNITFVTVKFCLFMSFTINLLFKLKLVGEICCSVGESEELQFMKSYTKASKISRSTLAAKFKLIIDLHNEVLNKFEKLVQVEETTLLTSEILLLAASVAFFILLLSGDLTRSTPLLFLSLVSYVQIFFVCLAGSLIQAGFEAVGNSLYSSKWYWLAPANRKVLVTIMITSNRARILSVGKCKSANLERFTLISKALYQIYFIVKVFLE